MHKPISDDSVSPPWSWAVIIFLKKVENVLISKLINIFKLLLASQIIIVVYF